MEPSGEPIDPLAALAGGDAVPFEGFVERQTPLFLAFFRRLGARASDAEDLTQDVMLRLYRNAASYQGQGRPEAYAFRVGRNAWIDHCRKSRLRQPTGPAGSDSEERDGSLQVASAEPLPQENLEREERAAELFAAIAGLGDGQRECFRLGVVEGRPYAEIANRLGIPVGTVKSRVFHAVQKLRGRLCEADGELRS